MNFQESLIHVYNMLEKKPENLIKINNVILKYSDAFKYIYENIEHIIGKNSHHNIILIGFDFHNKGPLVKCFTNKEGNYIGGHVIYLPAFDERNIFTFFWHMAHEMVHVFLSTKDNNILSSFDRPSVLEEGLATYISTYLYNKYFSQFNIKYESIINNDLAYTYAENLYKQIMILNHNDISFIKNIRKNNPSLKKLNYNDFNNIIITKTLIDESIADFQTKFNRFPGNY